MPTFACDPATLSQVAIKDTNRLVGEIAASLAYKSPFINLLPGGTFPAGVSDTIYSAAQLQAAPGDNLATPTFYCDTDVCGTSGSQELTDTVTYPIRLESKRGRGPKVCVKQGYAAFKGSYTAAVNSLKDLVTQYINSDVRYQLTRLSATKFVAKTGYTFDSLLTGGLESSLGIKFANVLPDAPLSFKALYTLASWLREVALADWFTNGGAPSFRFIAGAGQIELLRNESGVQASAVALASGGYRFGETTLTGYSFEASPAYRGVSFAVDQRPLRFNTVDANGNPVFINPVVVVPNASKNTAYARVNPAWLNANYEVGLLVASESFLRLVPESYVGEGPFRFNPQLHMGELVWHYQIDNDCNAFGDFGWHIYQITRAYAPRRPHHVIPVAYKRTPSDLGLVAPEAVTLQTLSQPGTNDLTCTTPPAS
jgi:hypothetical protein